MRRDPTRDAQFRERIEAVRERVLPSAVIGLRVELKKHGREFGGLCPFHNERTASFFVNDRKRFFHCFGCGAHGDAIGFVMRFSNIGFIDALQLLESEHGLQRFAAAAPAARAELDDETRRLRDERERRDRDDEDRKLRTALGIWEASHGLAHGDPVDTYLRGRALVPPCTWGVGSGGENGGWPADLRFVPELWHPYATTRHPAMVAAIRSPAGEVWAVHQTFLVLADRGHWTKASFKEKNWSKLVLGTYVRDGQASDRRVGGSIRLGPPAPSMIGGEGIETSLSAMQIWRRSGQSFVGSNNMPNVELPFGCSYFTYAADKDPRRQGERWAWRAARAQAFGRRVEVVVPRLADLKCDFNDVLARRAAQVGRAA